MSIHIPIERRYRKENYICHTWAAIGGSVASTVVGFGLNAAMGGKKKSSVPKYKSKFKKVRKPKYNPSQGSIDLMSMYPNLAAFAARQNEFAVKEREKIMPGSSQQFNQASAVLNSWLRGEVPKDVIDFTTRQVAQQAGGTFDPNTGGGNANEMFARNIGRLSSDFTQMGISSAPVWQQLADAFVTKPLDVAPAAFEAANMRYKYDVLRSEIDMYNQTGKTTGGLMEYESAMDRSLLAKTEEQNRIARANQLAASIAGLAGDAFNTYLSGGLLFGKQVLRPAGYLSSNGFERDSGYFGNAVKWSLNPSSRPRNPDPSRVGVNPYRTGIPTR